MKKNLKSNDKKFLQRSVDLAIEGVHKGGGPFGAVITRNDIIIAEAHNEVVYSGDPTAHAEILAIRKACRSTGSHQLEDCILYASCEPCPMCLGAIYWSGIKQVYYASDRTDAEKAGFSDKQIYSEIKRNPDKRRISFLRISDIDGNEAFRIWNADENKIPY